MGIPRKQWIKTASVAVDEDDGSLLVKIKPPTRFAGDVLILSSGMAVPLVSQPTPCRWVWVGAPVSDQGTPLSQSPIFIGDATNQNMGLATTDYHGFTIEIDDASKIYVMALKAGGMLMYRIASDEEAS